MCITQCGRRHFLVGSALGAAALLRWPTVASAAQPQKIAVPLAKLGMLKSEGGSVVVKVHDKQLLLVRDSPTTVRTLSAVCTHRHCIVAYHAADHRIQCPCHGSQYGLDGHVLRGPAPRPLEVYPSELNGEQIIVTLS